MLVGLILFYSIAYLQYISILSNGRQLISSLVRDLIVSLFLSFFFFINTEDYDAFLFIFLFYFF